MKKRSFLVSAVAAVVTELCRFVEFPSHYTYIGSGSIDQESTKFREKLDLFLTLRLKKDAKCEEEKKRERKKKAKLDQGSELFGCPRLMECIGIFVFSLAHEFELRGSDVYLQIVKKNLRNFFFKFSRATFSWMAFACNFFLAIFLAFF